MAFAKCPDCGWVWRYRAVRGSRVAWQICPKCHGDSPPVKGSREELKTQEAV